MPLVLDILTEVQQEMLDKITRKEGNGLRASHYRAMAETGMSDAEIEADWEQVVLDLGSE